MMDKVFSTLGFLEKSLYLIHTIHTKVKIV